MNPDVPVVAVEPVTALPASVTVPAPLYVDAVAVVTVLRVGEETVDGPDWALDARLLGLREDDVLPWVPEAPVLPVLRDP